MEITRFEWTLLKPRPDEGVCRAELYEQIGRLKVELEFLKKSCPIWRLNCAAGSSLVIAS